MTLAAMDGADVGRTAPLALFHDAHETRIGDVPSVGRAYVTTAAPEAITAHQTAAMPHEVAKVFQELTAEYEANETTEAQLAHDADKLETLLQAIEYEAPGPRHERVERDVARRAAHRRGARAGPGDRRDQPAMVVTVRRVLSRAAQVDARGGTF